MQTKTVHCIPDKSAQNNYQFTTQFKVSNDFTNPYRTVKNLQDEP